MMEYSAQFSDLDVFPDGRCRLILIGKTGCGKSSTGNTILGSEKFKAQGGIRSQTKQCGWGITCRNDLDILVMDTPGFCDTEEEDFVIARRITKSLVAVHPGPHAVLLCLRCDRRFTHEEYSVYNVLKDVFGERMTSFLIVIMVGADELEKENVSFEAQLEKSERLKTLLAEADNRYLLFNNKAKRKDVQVDRLLSMVKTMVVKNGGRYFRHKLSDQLSISMKVMMKEEIQLRQARQVTSDDTDTAMRIGGSGEGQEAKSATLDTRTVKTHSALYPAEEAGQVQMRGHQRSKSDTNQLDITSDAERPHSPGAAERMQELEELQKAGRVKEHRNRYSVREQEKRKKLAEMTPAPSALIEESLEATETAKEQAPFDEEESEWGGKGTAKASRAEKSTSAGVRQFSEEEERRMQAAIQQYKISRTAKALGPLQVGVPTIFVSHVFDTQPEQTSKGDRAIEDELIGKIVASEDDLTDGQREELEKASRSVGQRIKDGMAKFKVGSLEKCILM